MPFRSYIIVAKVTIGRFFNVNLSFRLLHTTSDDQVLIWTGFWLLWHRALDTFYWAMTWWGATCNSTPCVCLILTYWVQTRPSWTFCNSPRIGSLFWHYGSLTINKINHLGILELGLHLKSCGLWCAPAGF
jgi:hypothetical protein